MVSQEVLNDHRSARGNTGDDAAGYLRSFPLLDSLIGWIVKKGDSPKDNSKNSVVEQISKRRTRKRKYFLLSNKKPEADAQMRNLEKKDGHKGARAAVRRKDREARMMVAELDQQHQERERAAVVFFVAVVAVILYMNLLV